MQSPMSSAFTSRANSSRSEYHRSLKGRIDNWISMMPPQWINHPQISHQNCTWCTNPMSIHLTSLCILIFIWWHEFVWVFCGVQTSRVRLRHVSYSHSVCIAGTFLSDDPSLSSNWEVTSSAVLSPSRGVEGNDGVSYTCNEGGNSNLTGLSVQELGLNLCCNESTKHNWWSRCGSTVAASSDAQSK